jgi:mannitol/fructose-specific phosphotransferase system IIA component (Ntr-type)
MSMHPYKISRNNCLFNLEAEHVRTVIRRLVDCLKDSGDIADSEPAYRAVMTREAIRGTGLARGIACPHAKMDGISGVLVAVARLKTPVDFQASDRVPARHVFLILTSRSLDPSVHLKILSSIVRFYQGPGIEAGLDQAPDAARYMACLQACDVG